jgi:hypothetical protein
MIDIEEERKNAREQLMQNRNYELQPEDVIIGDGAEFVLQRKRNNAA